MKPLISVLFSIVSIFSVNSQFDYFNYLITHGYQQSGSTGIEYSDSGYYHIGTYFDGIEMGHFLGRISLDGTEVELVNDYPGVNAIEWEGAFRISSNHLYWGGGKTLDDYAGAYGVKYDLEGNIVWEVLPLGNDSAEIYGTGFTAVYPEDDGSVVFVGQKVFENDDDPFPDWGNAWLVKVNSVGEIIWQNDFHASDKTFVKLTGIEKLTDSGYLITGASVDPDVGPILIRTDSIGNHMYTNEFGNEDLQDAASWMVHEEGDVFTVIYQEGIASLGSDGWVTTKLHFARFDAAAGIFTSDITYDQEFDQCYSHKIIKTPDGGYALLGHCWYVNRFFYIKKVGPDGEEEWLKEYSYTEDQSNFVESYDIENTPDCGFIVSGITGTDDIAQGSWIVKLDACGDLEFNGCESCSNSLIEIKTESSFSVYPNPAQDILTLELDQITFGQKLKASLRNTLGQEVFTQVIYSAQTELDVSKVPSGVYVLSLVGNGRELGTKRLVVE